MSIVLDALKKTTASEKTSLPTPKTPGGLPSRGSLFNFRPSLPWKIIGLLIAGLGVIFWLYLSEHAETPGRDRALHKAGNPNPSPDAALAVLHKEGAGLLRAGDYPGALAKFSEIVSRRPGSPPGHNNLGLVFKKMGKKEEASKEYRKALALDPNYAQAMNNLAVLYREEGKKGEAEPLFLQALSKDPDYAEAHLNYALLLEETGRREESRAHYEAYIRFAPPADPTAQRIREILR